MAPGLIRGSETTSAAGGKMLETFTRLTLPMPAARRALSKALRGVEPSALPVVAATFVTGFQPIHSSSRPARLPSAEDAHPR